jgi:putative heme degradation protein
MEQDKQRIENQKEFRAMLEQLGITHAQAAELITNKTFRKVSPRTVKSWLYTATSTSARTCPTWAIKILQEIENEKNS